MTVFIVRKANELIASWSSGWRPMLRTIQDAVDSYLYPSVLIGCPDPHDEVWCTMDFPTRAALVLAIVNPA